MTTMKEIELPDPLPYPPLHLITNIPEISGKFCYILKHYLYEGIGLVVTRKAGDVCMRISDWEGNILQIESPGKYQSIIESVMTQYSHKIIVTMKLIGIPRAIFYFSNNPVPCLVDMRLSANKFCGPGYLADFFGKQGIPIQERVGDPVMLDKEHFEKITQHVGIYSDPRFIVKPSVFKTIIRGDKILPLYGITNETVPTP